MTELTFEEQEKVQKFLDTIPPEDLNLIALDRKYQLDWYREQLQALEEIDEFYADVGRVMSLADRPDVQRLCDEHRNYIQLVMDNFENAVSDLEDKSTLAYRKPHYDI